MKSMTCWIAIIATTLLGAACDDSPTGIDDPVTEPRFAVAPAERTVEEYLSDLTDVYFVFGCSADGEVLPAGEGELVRMEGQIYQRSTFMIDAAGGYHYTAHTMPVGLRGTGVTSGEEFRAIERGHTVANQKVQGSTGTYRQELKLTGRDTGRTFWLIASGNYRVTEDGDIIVVRDALRIECKAGRAA